MNMLDILLMLLLLTAVSFAVRKLIRDKKRGKGVCGDCAGCAVPCERREAKWK